MNDVIRIGERQSGNYNLCNYDVALRRLCVHESDGWKGIVPSPNVTDFNPDPPIFSSKFANCENYKHILAISNEDGMIAVQDTNIRKTAPESEKMLNGQQCHNNAVFDLEWMPGEMKFVSASGDHKAILWDVQDSTFIESRVFEGHSRSVKTAAFRKTDSAVFATGGRDGAIYIWDIRANSHVGSLTRADNWILSGHVDGPGTPQSHKRRPTTRQTQKLPPNIPSNSITGLVFQDDYSLISCGASDGIIKVWDLRRNYSCFKNQPQPKNSIPYPGTSTLKGYSNLLIDNSGLRLYVNCLDNNIYCYNLATYSAKPIMQYVGLINKSFYIKSSLSPDGQYLISGSSEEKAYIWNVNNSQPLVTLCGHRAEVTCVAWSQTKDLRIVTCSDDARHKVWRVGPEAISDDQNVLYPGYTENCKEYIENKCKVRLKALLNTPRSLKRLVERNETTPSTTDSHGTKRSFYEMVSEDLHCYEANGNEPKRQNIETKARRLFPSPSTSSGYVGHRMDIGCSTNLASVLEETDTSEGLSFARSPKRCENSPTKQNNKILLSPLGERFNCNLMSPETPSPSASSAATTIFSPTLNLPNYVINGEAPHLIAQSPKRKLKENVKSDWLTTIRKQKMSSSSLNRQLNAKLNGTSPSNEASLDDNLMSPRLQSMKSSDHSPRPYAVPKRRTSRCGSNDSVAPKTPTSRRNSILNFFPIMQSPNANTSRCQ